MWLPVLTAEDGYGLTYGARVSLVDALGRQTRLSVPLTWGGERRASVEVERRFVHGPLTRITADAGITRREHPALDASDRRTGAGVRAERALSSWFRLGAQARLSDVRFGDLDDQAPNAWVRRRRSTRGAIPRSRAMPCMHQRLSSACGSSTRTPPRACWPTSAATSAS